MKTTIVSLAGRTYTIDSLKFKAEREWRKKYDAPIGALVEAISNLKTLSTKEFDKAGDLVKEIGMTLLAHANDLVKAALDSPDTMLEALCDYSPILQADREWIEENAYQDEIAQAFVEVLQIAYPFGSILGMVKSLGSLEKQTMPSSPSANGGSGKTI